MDPFLLISGALALLGGGAGAYAWYQKTYNPTAAQQHDAKVAASGTPYTGPVVSASYSTPAQAQAVKQAVRSVVQTTSDITELEAHDAAVQASGTPYTGPVVSASYSTPAQAQAVKQAERSATTTPPVTAAPTKGPPAALGLVAFYSGLEAHI